ncbi:MAG: DNA polymerase III subunit alpha, partial [Treponema sp.]|nr:DNA polymerase III subunit alpha [Treponema sp.]
AAARRLEGLNRHSSIHAAGIVIGKTSLIDYVPLYRDQKTGVVASQYTMDTIEKRGLVKMDFLGLKTLDVIQHCEELIRLREDQRDFSIVGIPEDGSDSRAAAAYRMLGEGKSYGVFQFESEGMQKTLRDARPSSVEDLIALNALYRPGPIDNIPKFINSKWGRERIRYPHPDLENILKETYGVIVYQEQVMEVARIIGDYSLGQADLLRRAMSKKKMEEMVREKKKFLAGAVRRGYDEKTADEIFELLIPFAGYGFNKSHAAAYAVLAYQTAYLKSNFPVEFMAANMTNEISSVDKLPLYIEEARSMGISIDPPSINHSSKFFTVVGDRIVYGLLGIKGVGHGPAEEIIRCREEGPFRDFMDFLDRVNLKMTAAEKGSKMMESHIVGKKVIELLVKTGAFDAFGLTRAALLENLEAAFEYAQSKKEDRKFGQTSLFDDTGEKEYPDFEFKTLPEMDRMVRLQYEQELLGFYFSGHPMDDYREAWEELVTLDISVPLQGDKKTYTLIGMLTGLNKPFMNKKNEEMCYGTLQDYRGSVSLKFFPEVWTAHQEELREIQSREGIVAIRGKVDTWKKEGQEQPAFIVNELLDPEDLKRSAKRSAAKRRDEKASRRSPGSGQVPSAPSPPPPAPPQDRRELHIRLEQDSAETEGKLLVLRDYLLDNPGPCLVFIHVPLPEGEVLVRTASQIGANPSCLDSLARHAGVAGAWCE